MKNTVCTCEESTKPVLESKWKVIAYKLKFIPHYHDGGSGWYPHPQSSVKCMACHALWRTDEEYVEQLNDRDNAKN